MGEHEREMAGSEKETTNNRMELMAAISALEALARPSEITIVTDSAYVKNGITEWIAGWKRRGWRTAGGPPVKNVELWQQLDELLQIHRVKYTRVAGHSGHPENDRCDELAVEAYQKYL